MQFTAESVCKAANLSHNALPFTHCILAVIHSPYEWKNETEGSSEGGG